MMRTCRKTEEKLLLYYITENIGYRRQRLRNIVEKEARESDEREQTAYKAELTPNRHDSALKRANKNFIIHCLPKADIDGYFDRAKPHIKGPAKGNAVYKVNQGTTGKMGKACKFSRHVRP